MVSGDNEIKWYRRRSKEKRRRGEERSSARRKRNKNKRSVRRIQPITHQRCKVRTDLITLYLTYLG